MVASVLTPLQLIAGAGLLQNQGLAVNAEFLAVVNEYNTSSLIDPLLQTIVIGSAGGNSSILSNAVIASLNTLASNTCPALADSVPSGYVSLTVSNNPPGFTGLLTTTANTYMGNGDLSKFAQAVSTAQGYASITNIFLNSAENSQTYLADTFTTMNDMTTGDITSVNLATSAFGQDLENLGLLIDLNNLENLGSPLALVQRIIATVGNIPTLALAFVREGIGEEIVVNLNNPGISVTDSVQKLMYRAMIKITGDDLTQILNLLEISTVGIQNMADLLNPVVIFPNSFQSLTVPTPNGLRAIYINSSGTVNSNLANDLPSYVINSLS